MSRPPSLDALARAAVEDPGAGAVLHDALLERYGRLYGDVVQRALKDADAFGEPVEVRVQLDDLRLLERWNPTLARRGMRRGLVRPFYLLTGGSARWRPNSAITFVARPRWRPRAAMILGGVNLGMTGTGRVYDPRTNTTIAFRQGARWIDPRGTPGFSEAERGALNETLVRRVRTELRRRWSLDDLVRWLEWNDRNGDYRRIKKKDAIALIMEAVEETGETPEEMRAGSRRPWP